MHGAGDDELRGLSGRLQSLGEEPLFLVMTEHAKFSSRYR